MGLASKIKQSGDTTPACTNAAVQYAQAQATPPPSPSPYGAAEPSSPSRYYAQAHDGYGGATTAPQSPNDLPPASQYYAQYRDGGYGSAKSTPQSPSAPPFPNGQQSTGYGGAHSSSEAYPHPYPYPSYPQDQSYAQAYPYPGTPKANSQQPMQHGGFDRQQAYPSYSYPQSMSPEQGSADGQWRYDLGSQYQQPPSYAPNANFPSPNNANVLASKLQYIVQSHGLQRYYDSSQFQGVLQKLAVIDFDKIAAQWKIGKELAYDLASLALYDIVFYCDDSGSMAFEENGDRINDLRFILSKVSGIATLFDDDGIVVRFMNSNASGDGVRNAADVEMLMSQVRFSGATPLGTNLDRKVIQPFVLGQAMSRASGMAKPVLVIVITDGEPYGESKDTIVQVIRRAKDSLARTPYGSGALAVQIAQVGKDAKTQKFLEALDKDPLVGDMIDCTSYYEMEEEEFARKGITLTPELWLLKMCVGAIDPEYDAKDD